MAVHCSNCGEELLGAVNRCWKCSAPFIAPPHSAGLPPVRRSPVPLDLVEAGPEIWQNRSSPLAAEVVGGSGAAVVRRRGSPFAESHPLSQGMRAVAATPRAQFYRPPIDYARPTAATGGAIGSLMLGVLSLCFSYYLPVGALVAALLGVGLGLWGLYSERRGVAILGLVLCCLTIVVAGYFGALYLFWRLNGRMPWEQDPALDPSDAI